MFSVQTSRLMAWGVTGSGGIRRLMKPTIVGTEVRLIRGVNSAANNT